MSHSWPVDGVTYRCRGRWTCRFPWSQSAWSSDRPARTTFLRTPANTNAIRDHMTADSQSPAEHSPTLQCLLQRYFSNNLFPSTLHNPTSHRQPPCQLRRWITTNFFKFAFSRLGKRTKCHCQALSEVSCKKNNYQNPIPMILSLY